MRRIHLFLVLLLFCGSVPAVAAGESYVFVAQWGIPGSVEGMFNQPTGIATDGAGNLYVADTQNHRV